MKSRLFIIFTIVALSLSACVSLAEDITPPPDSQMQAPAPAETEAPAEESDASSDAATTAPMEEIDAERLFLDNCAICHGRDGKGVSVSADLTDTENMSRFPDAMLYALIAEGNDTGMPGFGDQFSEAEMDALVRYVRELSAEDSDSAEAEETPLAESADDGGEQAEDTSDAAEEIGMIRGTVSNGSGGELPDDLVVELQAYDHDLMTGGFTEAFTMETSVEDGDYLFEEIEMPEGRAFLTVVRHDGVSYSSEPDFITGGMTELEMPITFYETSTDTSQISVDRLHIFFEIPNTEAEIIQMVEVFIISNPTLYAIVPETEEEAVIEFLLPEGASNIQFEDSVFGERYTRTADGFGDKSAILPGMSQHQVIVFFELPYKRKMDFAQEINHPIGSATVMIPQGMKIKSDYLTPNGEQEAQGLVYDIYASQSLPAGSNFEMKVSGKVSTNAATGNATDTTRNIIYGALALGAVLIGVGIWFYLRERDAEYDEDVDEEDLVEEPALDDADALMDAIIALDDAYRAGDISEDVYKKRRATLKAQLKDLV